MPARLGVASLETLCLAQLRPLVTSLVLASADTVSRLPGAGGGLGAQRASAAAALDTVVWRLQELLVARTPHYLHPAITAQLLAALAAAHAAPPPPATSLPERRRALVWRQAVARWAQLLASPATTQLRLGGAGAGLGLVAAVCGVLPDVPNLCSLDLQPWSCVKHNLLHSREVTMTHDPASVLYSEHSAGVQPDVPPPADQPRSVGRGPGHYCQHCDLLSSASLPQHLTIRGNTASCWPPAGLLLTSCVRQVSDEAAATLCRLRLLRRLHLDQVRTISAYG